MSNAIIVLFALFTMSISRPLSATPISLTVPNAHGFVFEPWADLSDQEVKQRMQVIADSGARHVTFLVHVCQKDKFSSELDTCGAFKENLKTRTRWALIAKSLGMEVDLTIFPHTEKWDEWRGFFKPNDTKAWFASYTKALQQVAIASEQISATHLTLATEFEYLYQFPNHWVDLAQTMRLFYRGPLVINANWGSAHRGFWSAVDYISFSAYYPLSKPSNANPTVEDLRAAWRTPKATIKAFASLNQRPLMFLEIGYRSKKGATDAPWEAGDGELDLDIQTKAFKAFYLEWKDEVVLEKTVIWATEGVPSNGTDTSYNPIGKQAMDVLRQYFLNQ